MNSVSLGALVTFQQQIKRGGGKLAVVGVTGHCMKLMEVTGLVRVFQLREDLAGALEWVRRPVEDDTPPHHRSPAVSHTAGLQ